MKHRRFLSLLLSSFMIATLLSACNKSGEDSDVTQTNATGTDGQIVTPPPEELDWITLTMFVAEPGQGPGPDNEIVKMIEEETKVKIEFEFVVGDMDSRVGTMIASGNYPDIIGAGNARSRFMSAGAMIPLQDEIPKYPNLNAHYAPYEKNRINASPDENIYIMEIWGRYYNEPVVTFYNGPAFWIQKDVLAWDNYSNPTTLEEFFDLLERYYRANPTIDGQPTLPFEIHSQDWRAFTLFNAPQHLVGGFNDGDVFVHQDTLMAETYQDKDYAKTYFFKLNEMFKKGLINPATFTDNFDQYLAKISSGRVLAMFDQQWNFEQAENVLKGDEKYERTYVPLGLTYEGYDQWYKTTPTFVGGNGIGISVNCKDVHRALLFMDTLLREDLTLLAKWGIEGRDYYVDDNGRYRRTEEQRKNYDTPQWVVDHGAARLTNFFPKREGHFDDGNCMSPGDQTEEILEGQNDYDKAFFSKYGFATGADFLTIANPITPEYAFAWDFPLENGSAAEEARARMQEVQRNQLPRVIMAEDPEAAWTTYMGEWAKTNSQAYVDFVNEHIAIRMGIDR
ncbi:MAG: extracellular solute-binding protein [Oscillospiraceae bacterium]|jgi:putative aldouronate transport system substrate-binding protein|nr:extracellular solute-binding protein [Oscillospiraceae bacterium]